MKPDGVEGEGRGEVAGLAEAAPQLSSDAECGCGAGRGGNGAARGDGNGALRGDGDGALRGDGDGAFRGDGDGADASPQLSLAGGDALRTGGDEGRGAGIAGAGEIHKLQPADDLESRTRAGLNRWRITRRLAQVGLPVGCARAGVARLSVHCGGCRVPSWRIQLRLELGHGVERRLVSLRRTARRR